MLNGLQPAHVIVLVLVILSIVALITGVAVGLYALIRHVIRRGRQ